MIEFKVQPKSLGGFVRCLSGLFITKDNPHGLSPKECTILSMMIHLIGDRTITKNDKIELSNQLNQKLQVTVNYINTFKKKGVITKDDKLHAIFHKQKVTIEYGENVL